MFENTFGGSSLFCGVSDTVESQERENADTTSLIRAQMRQATMSLGKLPANDHV